MTLKSLDHDLGILFPFQKLDESEIETFLDAITRFQGHRLDDQRTSPSTLDPPRPDPRGSSRAGCPQDESFFNLLSRTQSRRINDQRCSSSMLQPSQRNRSLSAKCAGDDDDKENSKGTSIHVNFRIHFVNVWVRKLSFKN